MSWALWSTNHSRSKRNCLLHTGKCKRCRKITTCSTEAPFRRIMASVKSGLSVEKQKGGKKHWISIKCVLKCWHHLTSPCPYYSQIPPSCSQTEQGSSTLKHQISSLLPTRAVTHSTQSAASSQPTWSNTIPSPWLRRNKTTQVKTHLLKENQNLQDFRA